MLPNPVYDLRPLATEDVVPTWRAEHYEIAGYGTAVTHGYGMAVTHANSMGNSQVADLLAQTLQEEKQADEKLTQVAESVVNPQATQS